MDGGLTSRRSGWSIDTVKPIPKAAVKSRSRSQTTSRTSLAAFRRKRSWHRPTSTSIGRWKIGFTGVMENGLFSGTREGTPQGGPLSPLLSNLLLDELDRELASRGLRFSRYADDCNIYVKSRRAGERVLSSVAKWLYKKLRLKVNQDKSAVDRPWNRKFLGFTFTLQRKIAIAPQSKASSRNEFARLPNATEARPWIA